MPSQARETGDRTVATNRRARHEYEILESFECGLVLHGYEVKSIREGRVNIADAYGMVRDGEAFVEHFKARKLGTVVGVPSWGGLVGILNQQLTIDNGTVEQSNNAFYGRDGKWIVENHGGRLWAANRTTAGTTFRFSLPLVAADGDAAPAVARS